MKATAGGLVTDSYYGSAGQLLFQKTPTKTVNYVYLAGSLVAERAVPIGGGAETLTFQHTDALGTPVVRTNAARGIVSGSPERMTAYGEPADGSYADGPGYTGHVTDALSKLTYMQQRYYDPGIGRFLSLDPVTFEDGGNLHFNRYVYAYSNPLKFVDPDGRAPQGCGDGSCNTFFGENPSAREFVTGYNHGIGDAAAGESGGADFGSLTRQIGYGMGEGVVQSVERDPLGMQPGTRRSSQQQANMAEHKKGARQSTRTKHEEGQARRTRDAGNERGDDRRRAPRKKPPNHEGAWPPPPKKKK